MNEETKARLAVVGQRMTAKPVSATEPESMICAGKEKVGKQMAFWPEDAAAMPTELTRVSLFGLPSDKPGSRKMLDGVRLDGRSDVEIIYTGKQLSAKDETAWLACLRLGRGVPMGKRIYMDKASLLRECGLEKSGQNWKTLEKRLDRLSVAHIKVSLHRNGRTTVINAGMLKWGHIDDGEDMYIRLDPDGASLFENLAYQPWNVRLSLQTDVAALLLSYISGHQHDKAHSVRLDDLRRWCGYSGRLRQFRDRCVTALCELENKGVLVKQSARIISVVKGDVACWTRARVGKPSLPPLDDFHGDSAARS